MYSRQNLSYLWGMKKILLIVSVIITLLGGTVAFAAETTEAIVVQPPDEYYRARVITILDEGQEEVDGIVQAYQSIEAEILNAPEKGKRILIDHGGLFAIKDTQKVRLGDVVVLTKTLPVDAEPVYYIIDQYRTHGLMFTTAIFFVLAVIFGRKRGLTSIFGLVFSVIVIFYVMIPYIARGGNPLFTCLVGAFAILFFSLYLSHGFNRRTTIALVASALALGIAILIDWLFVAITHLTGTGAEEAMYLQFSNVNLDLRSLLLGGILIGVLGVLDDATTGQAAAVEEIHHANPALPFLALYKSGMSVGREHIASLINTLALVYVGASFPLLLLFTTQKNLPLWVILNGNFLAEEIVRTLVGSSVLVLAVPITTALAAYVYTKKSI